MGPWVATGSDYASVSTPHVNATSVTMDTAKCVNVDVFLSEILDACSGAEFMNDVLHIALRHY